MSKVFGFGIIGAGSIFHEHARALQTIKSRARLIGLADLDRTRLAKTSSRYFVPYTFTDYQELLKRQDIDIIVVATPPSTHEKFVIDALKAGKHVICEKPLAHSLESADRIIEAEAEYGRKVAVCYQDRFSPGVRRILWLRDNGWLGKLFYGHIQRLDRFSTDEAVEWWGRWNIAGGGVVMTQLIHELDSAIQIFGQPKEVFARMDTLKQDIESEDTVAATIQFENGTFVTCNATINAHQTKSSYDVNGEKASVHLPWSLYSKDSKSLEKMMKGMTEEGLITGPDTGGLRSKVTGKITDVFGGYGLPARVARIILPKLGINIHIGEPPLHSPLIIAFLNSIQENTESPISARDARKSLELCATIYESAIRREVVSLPL